MKYITFDIEATGLPVFSEFLCACAVDDTDKVEEFDDVDELTLYLIKKVEEGYTLVGHNIYCYDLPLMIYNSTSLDVAKKLRYLLRESTKNFTILDTLVTSRLYYPDRFHHTVESYAIELCRAYSMTNVSKIKITDFSRNNIAEIRRRCHDDVLLQHKLGRMLYVEEGKHLLPENKAVATFLPTTVELVARGVPTDFEQVEDARAYLDFEAIKRKAHLIPIFGDINLNSNIQIDKVLKSRYGKGLPLGEPSAKTQKRSPLFNKHNQHEVVREFPVLHNVLAYREKLQMKTFFVNDTKGKKSIYNAKKANRIYPLLNVINTRTHRAAYSKPPLNQMDKRLRRPFCVKGNNVMVGFDLIALELSIIAYTLKTEYSQPAMMDALTNGDCPKQATLDAFGDIFPNAFQGMPHDKLLSKAKTLNYAVLYGQSVASTCRFLKLPYSQKHQVEDALDTRFPALSNLISDLKEDVKNSSLLTLFGLNVVSPEYAALNTYAQASGAGYALRMLGILHKHMEQSLNSYPFIFNHDELNFVVKSKKSKEELTKIVTDVIADTLKEFESVYKIEAFSKLDFAIGSSWEEIH